MPSTPKARSISPPASVRKLRNPQLPTPTSLRLPRKNRPPPALAAATPTNCDPDAFRVRESAPGRVAGADLQELTCGKPARGSTEMTKNIDTKIASAVFLIRGSDYLAR